MKIVAMLLLWVALFASVAKAQDSSWAGRAPMGIVFDGALDATDGGGWGW